MRGYSYLYRNQLKSDYCFKSYPLAGVFCTTGLLGMALRLFQVIPPCGGIRFLGSRTFGKKEFQVIPPCGGIRSRRNADGRRYRVSSHTPLRGYSYTRTQQYAWYALFQVIPPCGGIQLLEVPLPLPVGFKSYPLAGVFPKGGI